MSLTSVDSEAYYSDSSSTNSNSFSGECNITSSIADDISENNQSIEIFYTPYDKYSNSFFQTEDNSILTSYIKKLFAIARNNLSCNVETNTTKAILVPHDSIRYSGLCAASAYFELTNRTRPIKNIILLCTSHHELFSSSTGNGTLNIMAPRFNKITTSRKDKFLPVDTEFINKIKHIIKIDDENSPHFQQEHSFFNQIPFLEHIAPNAKICPLLIGNILQDSNKFYYGSSAKSASPEGTSGSLDTNKLKNTLARLQIFINLLKNELAKNDTVLILSSNFAHINGHFDIKVSSNIFQNIRKLDNETLQFLYNIVDGNETRNQLIDTVLFMQNSCTSGIMAIYVFAKIMNELQFANRKDTSSSSSDSGSELSVQSYSRNQINGYKYNSIRDKYYFSRISCYYSSITREFINISDLAKFDKKTLAPLYEIRSINKPSISYVGLIYTKQPYIQKDKHKIVRMLTQYEELALLGLAREQLFYYLMKRESKISMPFCLIKPINAPVFALKLGVFITLSKIECDLLGSIGTLETDNDDYNIESNVKKYIIDTAIHNKRVLQVDLSEFHKLKISITILYKLAPITLNQYFTDKFKLGRDGIFMKLGKNQGYFLPSVALDLGLQPNEKNKFLDELCRQKIAGCDTKAAFRKYSNTQLFYNEGLEFHF